MVVICNYCNKSFSSYSSRSNHIKKYHINTDKHSINISEVNHKHNDKHLINKKIDEDKIYFCSKCNKEFSFYQSRWRHEKACQFVTKNSNEINELKKEILEMKNSQKIELENLKNEILKAMKIHPKTLQKINNQLNNNGIICNNLVIQLGYEDFNKVLSENEKIGLLNKHSNSVVEMVKLVHINPCEKYKQFKSMYITNLQNNVAYKYDEKSKKFIAITKNELLDSIIDNRLADIESFHEDYKEKITPFTSKHIQKFIERMSNEKEYKDLKKEEIKFAIYNGREEIIQQIKENNPDLNIFT
jgi:hypothetical protein